MIIINPYSFTAPAPGGDTTVLRISAGGVAVTSLDSGPDWISDASGAPCIYTNAGGANGETNSGNETVSWISSGTVFGNSVSYPPPAYTDHVDLWRFERYDSNASVTLNYVYPCTNGNYTVNLGMSELYHTTSGSRKFNVDINGVNVLSELDQIAKYGGRYIKGWESFPVTVSTGEIRIDLLPGTADNPKVNLIEIIHNG